MATQPKEVSIQVDPVQRRTLQVAVIGTRPLILNRMSEKARRELLLPAGRKNAAQKASSLKHNPIDEFRAAPYRLTQDDAPTLLALLSTAFKGSMKTAALDLPGAAKSQIGRLVYIEHDHVPVFGIPQLLMSVTRSADMNRTPDIRTRCIVPEWAAIVDISYVAPILNERSIVNLLAAGGVTSGVGDWRPEKGNGSYGQFELTAVDEARFSRIVTSGGREAQVAAMADPAFYDAETEDLFGWFTEEADRRGKLKAV
ncbi:MAG: hypothetical protein LC798_21910 [Chloroflexi bacterium]|nr:hypothetical protein [Chloroflexota bacterium]